MTSPIETEAKLHVPTRAVLERIAKVRRLGGYTFESEADLRIRTLYLDTADRDLARHETAFRSRKTADRIEATIKLPGEVSKGVHRREERTISLRRWPVFPFRAPRAIATRIPAGCRRSELLPLLENRMRRRVLLARRERGRRILAEVALDEVEFSVPGTATRRPRSKKPMREFELEIELRDGTEADLEALARVFRSKYRLRPSRGSKLERGLRRAGYRRPRRGSGAR